MLARAEEFGANFGAQFLIAMLNLS